MSRPPTSSCMTQLRIASNWRTLTESVCEQNYANGAFLTFESAWYSSCVETRGPAFYKARQATAWGPGPVGGPRGLTNFEPQ